MFVPAEFGVVFLLQDRCGSRALPVPFAPTMGMLALVFCEPHGLRMLSFESSTSCSIFQPRGPRVRLSPPFFSEV